MSDFNTYWNAHNYGAFQHQQIPNPPQIGDCVGYTNNTPYNYYNQYGMYPNTMYNTMYNPYEQERRRREQEEQQKQKFIAETSFQNKLKGLSAGYLKIPYEQQTPEQQLKDVEEYYGYLQDLQSFKDEHSGFDMDGFVFTKYDPDPIEEKPYEPSKVDAKEWLNNMGHILADIMEQEVVEQRNNLTRAYNSKNYNQLLQMHNSSSPYDPYTSMSIDDMEVKLPSEMSSEYQKRRERFMRAILE